MTETPEPSPQPEAAPPPPATPPLMEHKLALPIMIAVAVVALLVAGFFIFQPRFSGGGGSESYTVEPYTPTTEMISARERAPGYVAPDTTSPVAVEFGAGVTLNITGRVSRSLGGDWYAVAWNDQTVFVRAADATAGSGAPPTPEVRENEPEPEIKEPDEDKPDEDDVSVEDFPDAPSYGGGALGIGDVAWVREPNARDFARHFPQRALDNGQSGEVTLDCQIGGNGRLNCSIGSESPAGYGFGRAALNISRQLRVASTLPDGSPAAGRELRLPLSFRAR